MATRLPLALIDQAGNDRLDGFDTATASANTRLDAIELDTGKIDAIERRIGLNFLNDAVNVGVTVMGATDAFVDEFHDATGIVGPWSVDRGPLDAQTATVLISITGAGATFEFDASDTEVVCQSFNFVTGDIGKFLNSVSIRCTDDATGNGMVDGDVFKLELATAKTGGTVLATYRHTMIGPWSWVSDDYYYFSSDGDPFVVVDDTTTYWLRVSRESGTGVLPISYGTGNQYAGGAVYTTSGGDDTDKDFTYVCFGMSTAPVPGWGVGVPAAYYDTTGDYLSNNTGGFGWGGNLNASNVYRGASNAPLFRVPLENGRTIKAIHLYNNGATTATVRSHIVKWNGVGSTPTDMSQVSATLSNGGWSEHTHNYAIPDDGNTYLFGGYFGNHAVTNGMTEWVNTLFGVAGDSDNPGSAATVLETPSGYANGGYGMTFCPFWIEYETEVQDATFSSRQSTIATADSAPGTARIVALYDDISTTATLNTDIIFEVSRDGGSTWTAATMTNEDDYTGTIDILASGAVDISSQPSGTSMVVRARTINTKEQRVHGWWLQWS
jgi:hypothetical protein